MNIKAWTRIFKGLGNENRLKVIKFLYPNRRMTVSEIQTKLGISFKWTSANLIHLSRLGILESEGKREHVIHYLSPGLSRPILKIIQEFLSNL